MHRRSLLATGAAAITYGLAGCLGGDGGGEPVEFQQWLVSPGVFDRTDYPSPFRYFDFNALVDDVDDLEPYLEPYALEEMDPVLSLAGFDLGDVDVHVGSPSLFSVAEGDVDPDAVGDDLDSERFVHESEEDGLDIYRVVGELENEGALGVGDGRLIRVGDGSLENDQLFMSPASFDPIEAVSNIVGANEDESQRYTSEEDISTLVAELGDGDTGFGERRQIDETSIPSGVFAGQQAWGADFDVSDDTTDFTEVFVFAEGEEPPESELQDWLDGDTPHEWGPETSPSDSSLEIEENVAIVTGSFNTEDGFDVL